MKDCRVRNSVGENVVHDGEGGLLQVFRWFIN